MKPLFVATLSLLFAGIPLYAYEILHDKPATLQAKERPWGARCPVWQKYCMPVGNGKMGAMIYGGTDRERVQFNVDSLWAGKVNPNQNRENVFPDIGRIRELLLKGKYQEAEQLGKGVLGCAEGAQEDFGTYITVGELVIDTGIPFEETTNYVRRLDLDRALHLVEFDYRGSRYTRSVFASYPDRCIVIHFKVEGEALQDLELSFASPNAFMSRMEKGDLVIQGEVADSGLPVDARVRVLQEGGRVEAGDKSVAVKGARSVTFLLSADTGFDINKPALVGEANTAELQSVIDAAAAKGHAALLADHLEDYQTLYQRVSLDLGESDAAVHTMPMERRLARYKQGKADPDLEEMLFQYGRYLLIASSRPGSMPANLQGVWNNSNKPPWAADYHININLQMNYWLAGPANLLECQLPLIDYTDLLARHGRKSAQAYYEADGWTAFHAPNLWGHTAPRYPASAGKPRFWNHLPISGAWLAHNVYEHYAFEQDPAFMRDRIWPIVSGSADFLVDYLYLHPDGYYTSLMSWSSEHGKMSAGATCDHAIAREILQCALELAEVLEIEDARTREWKQVMENIMPYRIGQHGQLQEWAEDRDNPDDKHRHINHLWGLHPGSQISPLSTPELAEAANVTMAHRGDGATGWSLGWKLNFWSRLRNPDKAYLLIQNLLRGKIYPNLFDTHPPFQIDGNFGYTAGVCELLLQSQEKDAAGRPVLDILPTLPRAWPTGQVRGLRARGGFEVDLSWKDMQLETLKVRSLNGRDFGLRVNGRLQTHSLPKGERLELRF
ncbi:MAG: glycoside hydrolase family 95 protein [Verrucomicrobia bacterium]|jgi:alpha-L-fucosidase 2|nr:glycoside hydrolase family 95 protein [Verrucomicrobiota bacterium]